MKTEKQTIVKILYLALSAVVLFWTSSLTISFVASALPNMPFYVPYLAWGIFEGGTIIWLNVYRYHARGTMQRAIAGIICAADLVGVIFMVLAEILLGGQTWTAPPESLATYANWGLVGFTALNLAAIIGFDFYSPDGKRERELQRHEDDLFEKSIEFLQDRVAIDGQRIATTMADRMYAKLTANAIDAEFTDHPRRALNSGAQNGAAADTTPAHAVSLEVPDSDRPRPAGSSNGRL